MADPRAAWEVVERFEERLCEYTGSPYAVAVDSCTNALRLCFEYAGRMGFGEAMLPERTYVGVARAAMNSGLRPIFLPIEWEGEYEIDPLKIKDSARWLRRGMYSRGTWTCLSFQISKHLPIGRGGAILCDNAEDAEWFRRAAYDGRDRTRSIMEQETFQWGVHCYLDPQSAARGLWLMSSLPDNNEPLPGEYPDLSKVRFE